MRRIVYYNASKPAFRPFIIKVNSGADAQFTIPTSGAGYNYSLKVSDGQSFSGLIGNKTVIFASANTDYTLEIKGLFPIWFTADSVEAVKPRYVLQWGDILWSGFARAFDGCVNLQFPATDIPIMTYVNNTLFMFRKSTIPLNINLWDFSKVLSMNQMFADTTTSIDIDFTDLTRGSLLLENANSIAIRSMITTIKFIGYNLINITAPFNGESITSAEVVGLSQNITIRYANVLMGSGIDDLANNVKDLTGLTTKTVTMSAIQKASCDNSLWTAKNWTIAVI